MARVDDTKWTDAGAILSPDNRYRYRLWREWGNGGTVVFAMLNPSIANADITDPTIRRCVGFARTWGAGRLEVVNIFALRSTDPAALYGTTREDAIGDGNDGVIARVISLADVVVCAWGVHGVLHGRGAEVKSLVRSLGWGPRALKVTKDGQPSHPLYLPADSQLVDF